MVEDGTYLVTPGFNLNGSDCNNPTNSVPLLISFLRDEGGIVDARESYNPPLPLNATNLHVLTAEPTTDLNTAFQELLAPNTTLANAVINSGLFPLGTSMEPGNETLAVYNTTTEIVTDQFDRCSSQAAA